MRRRIHLAAAALEQVASHIAGAHLERKGRALAVHYRGVSPSRVGTLHRWANRVAAQVGLTILPGKKVWDLVPPGHRGKSRALSLIRNHLKNRVGGRSFLTVYAGDDATDAEAFRSLPVGGVGIQVGGLRGEADYRLRGVREVHVLLRWIAETAAPSSRVVPRPQPSRGRGARGRP